MSQSPPSSSSTHTGSSQAGGSFQDQLRALPAVDELVSRTHDSLADLEFSRSMIVRVSRELLSRWRAQILGSKGENPIDDVTESNVLRRHFLKVVEELFHGRYVRVVNATGIMLHTGLGRAVLSDSARGAVMECSGPCLLEVELETKQRSKRETFLVNLLSEMLGCQRALVVNNNAAAVLLALSGLAQGKEVIVSRGELVEIGGGFRVPDIMERGGAILKEVGTTNKVRTEDYRNAINENTGMILSVHSSNFKLVGFVSTPSRKEMAALSRETGVPFMEDIGSGYLYRFDEVDFPEEPTVKEALDDGVDLLSFSGDKLLGGPQAGIIVGRGDLVDQLRADSLFRSLRPDKMQLAALEETLLAYRRSDPEPPDLPFWNMAKASLKSLDQRGEALVASLSQKRSDFQFEVVSTRAQPGSGSVPGYDIESRAVTLKGEGLNHSKLDNELRKLETPVFARVSDERIYFDLRTVLPEEDGDLEEAILALPKRD